MIVKVPQSATSPAPPAAPLPVMPLAQVPGASGPATAAEMYQAMRAQKDVLSDQLEELRSTRTTIAQRLRSGNAAQGADQVGLEQRLQSLDARIMQMDAQIAAADAQLANAAAMPGAVVDTPRDYRADREEMIGIFSVMFLFVCVLPLSIAWARRIWKKNAVTISLPAELVERLDIIERGVDATALEIERIGEGQRFVTQLLASREQGAALPLSRGPDATPN